MSNPNKSILIFVAGVMVGGLVVIAWFPNTNSPIDLTNGGTATTTGSPRELAPDESGSVAVATQAGGETVVVESVTVPPPGVWVAVREVEGAMLGNILGAARARGPVSNLPVLLLRPTVSAKNYAIQLFRDDGDDVFSKDLDSAYVDFDSGKPVIAPFTTL